MLDASDLLITVWDEGPAAGIGGTAIIVEQAARRGMPIVLINPAAPTAARLLWSDAPTPAAGDLEALPSREAFAGLTALVPGILARVSPPRP
jgi:hypothetical protein